MSSLFATNGEVIENDLPDLPTGKFQSGTYDKPIVLLGTSGPGNELNRLAESLVTTLTTAGGSASAASSASPAATA